MRYIYMRDVLLKKAPRVLQRRGLFYTTAEPLLKPCFYIFTLLRAGADFHAMHTIKGTYTAMG